MKKNNYTCLFVFFLLLITQVAVGQSNIRLLMVDPDLDRITIKNFGTTAQDISDYRLCARFAYTPDLNGQTIVSGSLNLMPNAEVTLDITLNLNAVSSDFGLYFPFSGFGGFANANLMVDFTQWGAGGIGRESVAVTAGLWSAGNFIDPPGPYSYVGNGFQNGVMFWQNGVGGFDCPDIMANFGDPCDDGDDCTINDLVQADCSCAGTFQDSDGDGTCDANDICPGAPEPGTACNDGDACTIDDEIQNDCSCAGTFQDSDGDGTCDANDICPDSPEPGTPCDDGDACTIDDEIQDDCSCSGTFQDSDNDGTCDANDTCPDAPEPGTACDDGDPCTIDDEIQDDCSCSGTFQMLEVEAGPIDTLNCMVQSLILHATASGCDTCSFNWTSPNGHIDDGANTANPTVDAAGTYIVTLTNEDSGCTVTDSVTIMQTSEVALELINSENVTCNGDSTGLAVINATGGIPPFEYGWSNDGNGSFLANLPAGNYSVIATDQDGCMDTLTVQITEPAALQIELSSFQNVACNGSSTGAARVEVIGGTADFSFLWSSGSTEDFIQNVPAGTYIVSVTDANNCLATFDISLTEPPFLELSINGSDETALGAHDGIATPTIEGGVPPYDYNWSNGTQDEIANNLAPGTYQLTVIDQNGCSITSDVIINAFDCPTIFIDSEYTPLICPGSNAGNASVISVPGANQPVTYNWSTGSVDSTISNLPGGMYFVTITDSTNCAVIDVFDINEGDPTGPVAMAKNITISLDENGTATISAMDIDDGSSDNCMVASLQISQSQFDCDDVGQRPITLTVTDGVGNFSIDVAMVNVLDNQVPVIENCPSDIFVSDCSAPIIFDPLEVIDNCEVSITQVAGLESGSVFPAGATEVAFEVEDGAGNQANCIFTVTVNSDLNFEAISTPVTCNGGNDGQIEIMPSGGTPPYTVSGVPVSTPAGSYSITVTDDLGCSTTQSVIVTEPPTLSVVVDSIVAELNTESNGQVFITAMGGTGDLTFNWTDQEGNDVGNSEDISGLAAGTYFVWVTDENDCFIVLEIEIDKITAVNQLQLAQQIQVFPNPNTGQFNIQIDFPNAKEMSLSVYDMNGKIILQQHLAAQFIHDIPVDLMNAQVGVYAIRFLVDGALLYKRIVVSH